MANTAVVSRKQRLLRAALLVVSLAAFAYGIGVPPAGSSGAWFWRALSVACGVGSIATLVWLGIILRSPDDHLRCWEPDPTRDPTTRSLRLLGFGSLILIGVVATVGAVYGFTSGGDLWWKSLLVCIAWPTLLAGAIGLTLALRERQPSETAASRR